jgi:hypothetical protein
MTKFRLVAGLLLFLCPLAFADEPAARSETAIGPEVEHREALDDAPGVGAAADRSTAASSEVLRGNHRSIQVNVDAQGLNIVGDAANEPSLAIDPTNPDNIVIGWRQFDTISSNFRQAGYAYSHDGGETWTFPGVLEPGQFRSDPVLAADSLGTFFYYSLSTTTNAEMFISNDKGVSWTGPISAFGGDKTWMAADVTGGIGDGNLYAIWNSQFTCCAPRTDFTRSTDGGSTYEGPQVLPFKAKWGTVDVGPDGQVYVVGTRTIFNEYPQPHFVQRSSDARDPGVTPDFENTSTVNLAGETVTGQTPNPGGLMGQVWIAVDRSNGPGRGNVYVLGSVNPAGADPLDLHFNRSTDDGVTFGLPLRVNDDPEDNGAYQWFGTLSVAPNGRIDVIWNDTRNDPSGQTSEVYYAYSTDEGLSFSSGLPVTPPFNSLVGHPNQNKIGDYYHMVSDETGAGLAYSATFNGEQDVWFLRVGDCNANGVHDADDIDSSTSGDCDLNGIPDECQDPFHCPTCNDNALCEATEDCSSCGGDCPSGLEGCGNGTCELGLGEDCLSCPEDCNGLQQGNPGSRFCCGDGEGDTPVDCTDSRCTTGGFACDPDQAPIECCGDGLCQGGEDELSCQVDCAAATPGETTGLLVTAVTPEGVMTLGYTPGCGSPQHTIVYGDLAAVGSYGYEGQVCDIGASGTYSGFDPGPGSFFFLLVGHDEVNVEGSYGLDSSGAERPQDFSDPSCNLVQDLTRRCD